MFLQGLVQVNIKGEAIGFCWLGGVIWGGELMHGPMKGWSWKVMHVCVVLREAESYWQDWPCGQRRQQWAAEKQLVAHTDPAPHSLFMAVYAEGYLRSCVCLFGRLAIASLLGPLPN